MFKKLQRNIVFLFMLFIIPLTIGNVDCTWVYYEGSVIESSSEIKNVILGEFNYDLNPGFPNTPEGQDNSDALDNILTPDDPALQNNGLSNPDSLLNKGIGFFNIPSSGFITSVDAEKTNSFNKTFSGEIYRKELGIKDSVSFAIVKGRDLPDENNYQCQEWIIYTTSFDITQIKLDKNNNILPISPSVVTGIYKTVYKWKSNTMFTGSKGKYTKISEKSSVGWAPTKVNTSNNPNVGFFDPKSWVEGEPPVINIIGGNSIAFGESMRLSANIIPTSGSGFDWSISQYDKISNTVTTPSNITIDNSGVLTANQGYYYGDVIINATTNISGNKVSNYHIVTVNIPKSNPNFDGSSNSNFKTITLEENGYLYPSSGINQGIKFTIPKARGKEYLIVLDSFDKNAKIVKAQYVRNNSTRDLKVGADGIIVSSSKSYPTEVYIVVSGNGPVHYSIQLQ